MRGAYSTLALAVGFVFVIGGPERTTADAYLVVNTTGGPYVWGALLLVIGVVTAVAPRRWLRWMLLLAGAVYAVLSVAFTISAFESPYVNFLGPVGFGWVAAMHACASEKVRKELSWMPPLSLRSESA